MPQTVILNGAKVFTRSHSYCKQGAGLAAAHIDP